MGTKYINAMSAFEKKEYGIAIDELK